MPPANRAQLPHDFLRATVPNDCKTVLLIDCGDQLDLLRLWTHDAPEIIAIESDRYSAIKVRRSAQRVIEPLSDLVLDREFECSSFECIIALARTESSDELLRRIAIWLSPNGLAVIAAPNARYHERIQSTIFGQDDFSISSHTMGCGQPVSRASFERSAFRHGLAIECVHNQYGAGFKDWQDGGQSHNLSFGSHQYSSGSTEEAEEFFVETYTFAVSLSTQREPLVSIVVLSGEEDKPAEICVRAIVACTRAPFECLVLDQGLLADTRDCLVGLEQVRLLECNRTSNMTAIKTAVENCRGEYVCVIDPHCIVTSGWLDGLLCAMRDDSLNGAIGPQSNVGTGSQRRLAGYSRLEDLEGFAWKLRHERLLVQTDTLDSFCFLARTKELNCSFETIDSGMDHGWPGVFWSYLEKRGKRKLVAHNVFVHAADANAHLHGAQLGNSPVVALDDRGDNCQLSLCMIVRDNEDTIVDCLKSIRPWVDEMIVVDTGSQDRTAQICESHGARVFHFPWCDDFSAARNESLKHAHGSWVFWMDSDDVIPTEQGRKLRMIADRDHSEDCLGYVVRVHCPSADDSQVTVVDHVKLFRNLPQLRFEHRIHEQILPSIRRHGGTVQFTDVYVVHAGSRQTPQQHSTKLQRDFRLLQMEDTDRPNHPFVLFNLGMTCENARKYDEAIGYLKRSIEVSEPGESHLRKAWALLTCSLQQTSRYSEAMRTVDEALVKFPNDPELLFRRAMVNQIFGRFGAAVDDYEAILANPAEEVFRSMDPSICGAKTHHNLAVCLRQLGQTEEAIGQYEKAVGQMPQLSSGWVGLSEILREEGSLDRLKTLLESPALNAESQRPTRAIVEACVLEVAGDFKGAVRAIENCWHITRARSLLFSLAAAYARRGDLDAEIEALVRYTTADSSDTTALACLGRAYWKRGDREQGIGCLELALEHSPNSESLNAELAAMRAGTTRSEA